MTTVFQLILKLQAIKSELQDKEVLIVAENGLLVEPEIKFSLKEIGTFDKTKENVEYIVLGQG